MESSASKISKFQQILDELKTDMDYSPNSSSPHFELFNAAYTGDFDRFKRLALNHADDEVIALEKSIGKVKDDDGRGCLHFAAAGGSLEVCKYLLETLKLGVDSKDGNGITSLYHATIKGHFDTVTYLLEKGANPDVSNNRNVTPLHYAAKSGNTKIITLLLSRGVRADASTRSGTPLHLAAGLGHRDAVHVLLDHGADPNIVFHGMVTPLMSTILVKSWECMELLLQACAEPNGVFCGSTPLILAVSNGRVEDITRLLEAGADPNVTNSAGLTALEVAAIKCKDPIIGVLFPVTSPIPTYPDWSIGGLMKDVNSDANKMQRELAAKEKYRQSISKGRDALLRKRYHLAAYLFTEALAVVPTDADALSNLSLCYAHLDGGIHALDNAIKCLHQRPEWPKAYCRIGVALNILKRYSDAADAFLEASMLDPGNENIKDAYMDSLNSSKVYNAG
ncbi:tankyrase-2-like [Papaver somniferum]|uniref:tankyrase-2-like n=1 Tax=Papaver somniferum TaxID=3469 RepID=UPI000E705724|nr:tankyrase-2-like [Papaver somniferum]